MSNAKRRRVQAAKGRDGSNTGGNREYTQAMQGLRGSNAAQPHRLKTRYVRKTRQNTIPEA